MTRPRAHVVAVSGRIASGKSTFADALARATGWTATSFGAYVRSVAAGRGLGSDRSTLQAVGSELVQSGTDAFVADVLESAGWCPRQPIIIEGVRHLAVLESIGRTVEPLPVLHVHVAAGDPERRARASSRGEGGRLLEHADEHATEHDVRRALVERADVIADGTGDLDMEVGRALRLLRAG